MTDLSARRQALRVELRARRAGLDEDDQAAASMAVMARLARMPILRRSSRVSGYRAVRGEVDIDAALVLLMEAGVVVTVPRVIGDHLEFLPWHPDHEAAAGSFGIAEPVDGEPIPMRTHDVVLTPLVAFDQHGHRLGQGGGYYDRALAGCGDRRPVVIGVAHAFQQVDAVPVEAWDIPLDAVVTEEGVIEFRTGALDPPSP